MRNSVTLIVHNAWRLDFNLSLASFTVRPSKLNPSPSPSPSLTINTSPTSREFETLLTFHCLRHTSLPR